MQAKNETLVQAAESQLALNLAYAHYYKVWLNLIITSVLPVGKITYLRTLPSSWKTI